MRVPGWLRPRGAASAARRAAVERVLEDPTWELIPLKNARAEAAALPPGSTVSVTASPAKGLEATVELALELQRAGHHVIPHLSARMVRDEEHLRSLVVPLRDAGIDRAFVVGGDEEHPGAFDDALSLLEAMERLGLLPAEVGIGCYPQGHPIISDDALLAALAAKARYASYMTTQLCFDPKAIETWLAARRSDGIALPLKIGIPGVAEIPKLLSISARIGVRDAGRFVLKNRRFVGELLKSGGIYRPAGLLESLAPLLGDPAAGVLGVHVYTFNNVGATEAWRVGYLGR
jgi:methylenetetrahydrofolate reductase (NADPH)